MGVCYDDDHNGLSCLSSFLPYLRPLESAPYSKVAYVFYKIVEQYFMADSYEDGASVHGAITGIFNEWVLYIEKEGKPNNG